MKILKFDKGPNLLENNEISIKDFIKYLQAHSILVFATIVILFLLHGYLVFNNNIGVDTILFTLDPETNYNWLENGRYGLIFEKYILNLKSFSMFYAESLFMCFLILFCFVVYYTFYKISGKDFDLLNLSLPLVGLSSPIFAEQFIFTLQSAETALSLLLTILAVLFIYKWIIESKFIYSILGIALMVISFGSYQSFVILYIVFCLFSFILLYENKEFTNKLPNIWILVLKLLSTFLISFIIYFAILNIINADFDYLNSSNWWKIYPFDECLELVMVNIKGLILPKEYFYNNFGLPIFVALTLAIGLYNTIKNKNVNNKFNRVTYFLVYILFSLSPIFLIIIVGGPSVARSNFFIPIIECLSVLFVSYYLCNNKYKNVLKYTPIFILCILFFHQANLTESLYYGDYLIRENEKETVYQLTHDLEQAGAKEGNKVFFYGYIDEKINASVLLGESLGAPISKPVGER